MLTKLLLTGLVILIGWRVIQHRNRNLPPVYLPPENTRPAPKADPARRSAGSRMKLIAVGIVSLLMLGSLWFMYDHWYDARRLVDIRVINTTNGEVTSYTARKGDVDLEHGAFTSLAGHRVVLAGVERLEMHLR